jgi:hypothetical protein
MKIKRISFSGDEYSNDSDYTVDNFMFSMYQNTEGSKSYVSLEKDEEGFYVEVNADYPLVLDTECSEPNSKANEYFMNLSNYGLFTVETDDGYIEDIYRIDSNENIEVNVDELSLDEVLMIDVVKLPVVKVSTSEAIKKLVSDNENIVDVERG